MYGNGNGGRKAASGGKEMCVSETIDMVFGFGSWMLHSAVQNEKCDFKSESVVLMCPAYLKFPELYGDDRRFPRKSNILQAAWDRQRMSEFDQHSMSYATFLKNVGKKNSDA
jgi:hypothetical protein